MEMFPPSLNWDETSIGYNAYSLLKTGRDEWNFPLPIVFRAFGDFKLPLYIYSVVPGMAIFGPSDSIIRLPSMISGLGLVVISYLVSRRYGSKSMALITSFLVAVSPWDLFLSRVAVEANLGAFLLGLGVCLLLYRKNFTGILFLGLSAWTYNSARIFAPLFLFFWWGTHIRSLKFKVWHYVLAFVIFIPVGFQLLQTSGQIRIQQIGIIDSGAIAKIETWRNADTSPLVRFVYNRPVYFVTEFVINYFKHFSPNFLFVTGGSHYQFNIPNFGLLHLVSLPFFYLGLGLAFKNYKKYQLLLFWLFLSPIAGSLTRDAPHTLRAVTMLPLPMIFSALAVVWVAQKLKLFRLIMCVFVVLTIIGLGYYAKAAHVYKNNYSWAWQYGYQEAVRYTQQYESLYAKIIFTKRYAEPHEFVLWYTKYPPRQHLQDLNQGLVNWNYHDNWYWVDGFNKYVFVNDWEMPVFLQGLPRGQKYLVVASPDNPGVGKLLKQINFLDGRPAFVISALDL